MPKLPLPFLPFHFFLQVSFDPIDVDISGNTRQTLVDNGVLLFITCLVFLGYVMWKFSWRNKLVDRPTVFVTKQYQRLTKKQGVKNFHCIEKTCVVYPEGTKECEISDFCYNSVEWL